MALEVELRSFVSREKHDKLIAFFHENAEFVSTDFQETYYFDCGQDLRIQRNNSFSKIWLKKGRIHDEAREEIEVRFERSDFEKLNALFLSLGFGIKAKWLRERNSFSWEGVNVFLDNTVGYGFIIELEKICCGEEKEKALELLKQKMHELNVEITPNEQFDAKYHFYLENWRDLLNESPAE